MFVRSRCESKSRGGVPRAGSRVATAVDWTADGGFGRPIITPLRLVFYWIPLTSETRQHPVGCRGCPLSPQKYFADRVLHGLPFWTPYIFSGFPFLADPQVAAWYPPNWPFFLAGIGPRAIQSELAVHALMAFPARFSCSGA